MGQMSNRLQAGGQGHSQPFATLKGPSESDLIFVMYSQRSKDMARNDDQKYDSKLKRL